MDQRPKNLITQHKALHSRDNIVIVYVSRKESGRGFEKIKDGVDILIRELKNYIKKSKERSFTAVSTSTANIRAFRFTNN